MGEGKNDLALPSHKTLPGIKGRNYTKEGEAAGEHLTAFNKALAEINSGSEELYRGVATGLTHLLTMTDIESPEPVIIAPGVEARVWKNKGFFNKTYGGYLSVTNPEEKNDHGLRRYYGSPARRDFTFEFRQPKRGEAAPLSCDINFSTGNPEYSPLLMRIVFDQGRAKNVIIAWPYQEGHWKEWLREADHRVWRLMSDLHSFPTFSTSVIYNLENGLSLQTLKRREQKDNLKDIKPKDVDTTFNFNEALGRFTGSGKDREKSLQLKNILETFQHAVAAINLQAIPE